MNSLSEWVRNLVVLVFVISAAQLLVPTNNMRPYVRFVLGLVIISVLLTSIFELSAADFRFDLVLFPDGASESGLPYIEQGQALATQARDRLLENGNERIVSQVTSVTTMALGFEPEHVTVRLNPEGTIRLIEIVLPYSVSADADTMAGGNGWSSGPGPQDVTGSAHAQRAARIIAGFVGVEPSVVQFHSGIHGRGGALR